MLEGAMTNLNQVMLEQHFYLFISLGSASKPSFHHLWWQFTMSIPNPWLVLVGSSFIFLIIFFYLLFFILSVFVYFLITGEGVVIIIFDARTIIVFWVLVIAFVFNDCFGLDLVSFSWFPRDIGVDVCLQFFIRWLEILFFQHIKVVEIFLLRPLFRIVPVVEYHFYSDIIRPI